ncbi:divergent polysaccharide deacetylase family protein, partial [Rhizobiaceae sp. 2RAB30]
MSPANNSLDSPLGQSNKARQKRRRGFALSRGGLALGLAAIVVVAASGVIALREKPFRTPAPVVAAAPAEPAPATSPDVVAPTPQNQAPAAGGPSIIRVDPDAPRSGGD